MELSILIPTYNCCCTELVKALHRQATAAGQGSGGLRFEIIVADDGSTDSATVEANREIDTLSHCRYIVNRMNRGRAAIRNFLAREARYARLLFIDSDMTVTTPDYISRYAAISSTAAVYGGYTVPEDKRLLGHNLRYTYEWKYRGNADAGLRNKNPYGNFHTCNFTVPRDIMLSHPLDERFRRYGYEDVLWGSTLRSCGIRILHIDNPLCFGRFESNADFISKTEEGIGTLFTFRRELQGYSTLLTTACRLSRLHLTKAASLPCSLLRRPIINNLKGNKPSLFLFNIYKLSLLCTLLTQAAGRNHRNQPQ